MDTNWGGALYSAKDAQSGAFAEDTRRSYDNPYISRTKNIAFQDELPRESTMNLHQRRKQQSPQTKREISSAYGGNIDNSPMERAISISTSYKD